MVPAFRLRYGMMQAGAEVRMNADDRRIVRELARQVAEVAALPVMEERRNAWKRHNSLKRERPLVLVFPEGAWRELLPQQSLACEDAQARAIEAELRTRLYQHDHFLDDKPVERAWHVSRIVNGSDTAWGVPLDWGLQPRHHESSQSTGAWGFDPVFQSRDDIRKLRIPQVVYDEAATLSNFERIGDLLGDILDVRLSGVRHVSFHFSSLYIHLRGLEPMLMDMMDEPDMVHEVMAFFERGYREVTNQLVEQNLLSLNNDGSYHSSGGVGYTDELPAGGFDPTHVRTCDIWASAESQEMAPVSPAMHDEFLMQYERRVLEPFGLNGYGCCEDLTRKLDRVVAFPHMRRISISPWACVEPCAEALGGRFIFSWKPQPSHLVGAFDEAVIRGEIRRTLEAADRNGCVLEMVLKDTHTCQNRPERFTDWTRIAREEIGRMA